MNRVFLSILIILTIIFLFFINYDATSLRVIVVLPTKEVFRDVSNHAYEAIQVFKRVNKTDMNLHIKVIYYDDSKKFVDEIKKFKPSVIISTLHKPELEEFIKYVKNTPVINTFPFTKMEEVLNITADWNDVLSFLAAELKRMGVSSVKVVSDGRHPNDIIEGYVKKMLGKKFYFDDQKADILILIAELPSFSSSLVSNVIENRNGKKVLVLSHHQFEYWQIFGKYIEDFYGVFLVAKNSEYGEIFESSFQRMYKRKPEWVDFFIYDSLCLLNKYGKKFNTINKFKCIGPTYEFKENSTKGFHLIKYGEFFGVKE